MTRRERRGRRVSFVGSWRKGFRSRLAYSASAPLHSPAAPMPRCLPSSEMDKFASSWISPLFSWRAVVGPVSQPWISAAGQHGDAGIRYKAQQVCFQSPAKSHRLNWGDYGLLVCWKSHPEPRLRYGDRLLGRPYP